MLVSTISNLQEKMVGRDGFEPSTNWLKGISRLLKNQWVRCRNFTLRRSIVPLRINNLHIGFTELLTLKTLHPQSRVHNSDVIDIPADAGVLA
jgi:hypothetical protein